MSKENQPDAHLAGAQQAAKAGLPIDLLKAPLWKALLFMALPATIGFVFNTLYNVVDVIYARSWPAVAGSSTQDALGATFPLFFLQLGFGIGLYQGVTALISNAYGRKDQAAVRDLATQAVTYGVLVGFAVAVLGFLILRPILVGWQGLDEIEYTWAAGYMVAVICGAPLIVANFGLYALLSGAGNNRAFGVSLTIAFFLNIGLNYVFMHTLGFGLMGLGLATLLIQGPLNTLYVVFEVRLLGVLQGVRLRDFWPRPSILWRIVAQAMPASISMLIVAVSVLILNGFAQFYANGTLGGISAAARIEQVVLLPIIGVGIGSLAIIGQNYGAGQMARVKAMFDLMTGVILALTLISTLILLLFSEALARLIANPGQEALVAQRYLLFSAFAAVPFGLLYIATSFKTGMRQPLFATAANALRLIILPSALIPLIMLTGDRLGQPFDAIPLGTLIAGVLIGGGAFFLVWRQVRRLG